MFESENLDEMIASGNTIDVITLVTNLEAYKDIDYVETKYGALKVLAASIKDEFEPRIYLVSAMVPIGIGGHTPIPENGEINFTATYTPTYETNKFVESYKEKFSNKMSLYIKNLKDEE